jgi:hypothetical protein
MNWKEAVVDYFKVIIPAFASRDWEKPWKSLVSMVGLRDTPITNKNAIHCPVLFRNLFHITLVLYELCSVITWVHWAQKPNFVRITVISV